MTHGKTSCPHERSNDYHHLLSIHHVVGTIVRALTYVSFNLHNNPMRQAFSLILLMDKEIEAPIGEWLHISWYVPALEYYVALKIIFSKKILWT